MITYPPELLPYPDEDQEAEVIVITKGTPVKNGEVAVQLS